MKNLNSTREVAEADRAPLLFTQLASKTL